MTGTWLTSSPRAIEPAARDVRATHGGGPGLDRGECLRLLATAVVGRIVFTERALPSVMAVHYALDGDCIVIKTSAASIIVGAARHAIVAFEVRSTAPRTPAGAWWPPELRGSAPTPWRSPTSIGYRSSPGALDNATATCSLNPGFSLVEFPS